MTFDLIDTPANQAAWERAMRGTKMNLAIHHPTDRPNFTIVTVGTLDVAFSYTTPVGFNPGDRWTVRINVWGPTTGKHLNHLDGGGEVARDLRRNGADFQRDFEHALKFATIRMSDEY